MSFSGPGRNPERSAELHSENVKIFKMLHQRFPMVLKYRVGLARAHGNLADAHSARKDYPATLQARHQAFRQYCEISNEFGLQRDIMNEIFVIGLRLYIDAQYLEPSPSIAMEAYHVLRPHLGLAFVHSEDVTPIRAVIFCLDVLRREQDASVNERRQVRQALDAALQRLLDSNALQDADYRTFVAELLCRVPQAASLLPSEIQELLKAHKDTSSHPFLDTTEPTDAREK